MPAPPPAIETAFLAPVTRHSRRVDIYQADGSTMWLADAPGMNGTVNIDYSRAERRSIDMTFDNTEGVVSYAPNNFWYDKILKIYRGVDYETSTAVSQTVLATNLVLNPTFGSSAGGFWTGTTGSGAFSYDLTNLAGMMTFAGSAGSSFQSAYMTAAATSKIFVSAEVKQTVGVLSGRTVGIRIAYYDVGSVLLSSTSGGAVASTSNYQRLFVTGTAPVNTVKFRLFVDLAGVNASGDVFLMDKAMAIVDPYIQTPDYFDGTYLNSRWTGAVNNSTSELLSNVYAKSFSSWETQIGEFMIDSLKESHFPDIVSISGRDYAKRMLNSKFTVATGFTSTDSLEATIGGIAGVAGIPASKRVIPITGKTLGRSFTFERGVSRWEACKQIVDAFSYELFFDSQGFLIMREFYDPTTSPLIYSFKTGQSGTLVTYDKTVSDGQLYNHIVVTGEATDTIPVWAEARNDNPSSPTNIAKIGDRVYIYTSAFITTTAQAQLVADQLLSIYCLQEYDFNFSSLLLPWLEVGEIVEFIDPKATITQPDRFLLSNVTLPYGVGVMSGTGKRVTILG